MTVMSCCDKPSAASASFRDCSWLLTAAISATDGGGMNVKVGVVGAAAITAVVALVAALRWPAAEGFPGADAEGVPRMKLAAAVNNERVLTLKRPAAWAVASEALLCVEAVN